MIKAPQRLVGLALAMLVACGSSSSPLDVGAGSESHHRVGMGAPSAGPVNIFGTLATITPSALGGVVNNYSPAGLAPAVLIQQDAGVNSTITGLVAQANTSEVVIRNIASTNSITLSHESTSSTAANRFTMPQAIDWTMPPGSSMRLRYNSSSTRWEALPINAGIPYGIIDRLNLSRTAYTSGTLPAQSTVTNDWNPWGAGPRTTVVRVTTDQFGSTLGSLAGGNVGDIVWLENHGDGTGSFGAGDLLIRLKKAADLTCDTGNTTTTVATGAGNATYTRSTGSFLADGFYIGQSVTWTGYANGGNNVTAVVTNLSATVMTFALTTQTGEAGTGDERVTANIVANHIYLPNLENLVLPYTGAIELYYDANNVGWIPRSISMGGAVLKLSADLIALNHPLTPSQLAGGNNNDYDPATGGWWGLGNAGASWLRLNGGTSSVLTGLVSHFANTFSLQGEIKFIQNVGNPFVISHEDTNSSAANRFFLPGGSMLVPTGAIVAFVYDVQGGGLVSSARWRPLLAPGMHGKYTESGVITPALAGGNNNDFNPAGLAYSGHLRVTVGAASVLTGLTAQEDGAVRTITAFGQFKFTHQDANSLAANRFYLPTNKQAGGLTLNTGDCVTIRYDATNGWWFVIGLAQ